MSAACTVPVPEASPRPYDVSSDRGLLQALAVVDRAGWEDRAGTDVLMYARLRVVRPQVRRAGLTGPAAHQAEATGWAVAWELLSSHRLREASSPWGLITVAVRRAVLGEVVTAAYGTGLRQAWRLAAGSPGSPGAQGDACAVRRPVSLSALEPDRCAPPDRVTPEDIGPTLELIVAAMVGVGWRPDEAVAVCHWVAGRAPRRAGTGPQGSTRVAATGQAHGWRTLARLLGIPAWRARRATVLLLGSASWPGLVEQVTCEGPGVLQRPDVVAAVRSTVMASHLSPIGAAQRAMRRRAATVVPTPVVAESVSSVTRSEAPVADRAGSGWIRS